MFCEKILKTPLHANLLISAQPFCTTLHIKILKEEREINIYVEELFSFI